MFNTETGTNIERAAKLLHDSELVAIPTETVYGLAANGLDSKAIMKIFNAKKRPLSNPLILHFKDIESVAQYTGELPLAAQKLAHQFWPGPLTLLLDRRDQIPDIVNSGREKVAVRVPQHPMLLHLLTAVEFPLAAPSANLYGRISPTTAEHVSKELSGVISYILDGGPCTKGIESTIIGFEGDDTLIYRLGALPVEDIELCIGKKALLHNHTSNIEKPVASGMVNFHYAPQTPIFDIEDLHTSHDLKNYGYIGYDELHNTIPVENQFLLSPDSDLNEASRNLYTSLHFMDSKDFDGIFICQFPEYGLGQSINDRINKAIAKFKT